MKKINKTIKYDFIIYTCLLFALVLIGYSSYNYLSNQSYSLKELLSNEPKQIMINEPQKLSQLDKKALIEKYIIDLKDETKKDKLLTPEIVHTWSSYEIIKIKYNKEISNNYYSYIVDIKINDLNSLLPVEQNAELSKNTYNVITLKINILYDENIKEYQIKSTDL